MNEQSAERDIQIHKDIKAGATFKAVSRRYSISRQRVYQIFKDLEGASTGRYLEKILAKKKKLELEKLQVKGLCAVCHDPIFKGQRSRFYCSKPECQAMRNRDRSKTVHCAFCDKEFMPFRNGNKPVLKHHFCKREHFLAFVAKQAAGD